MTARGAAVKKIKALATSIALLFGTAFSLSGCSSLPTSGKVEYIPELASHEQRSRVNVAALPPQPGASAEMIVEGFLAAMESSADNYSVAKQYLTPQAAEQWDPTAGVLVYSNESSFEKESSNVLKLPLTEVGNLSGEGLYSSKTPRSSTVRLRLQEVDGELRISNPMTGILLSQQRFVRSFTPLKAYFVANDEKSLAHQLVYVPSRQVSMDETVRTVIRGPGEWLRPVVKNYAQDASIESETWVDNDQIARVSLNDVAEEVTTKKGELLAAQLLMSLQDIYRVKGIKVSVNGKALKMPGGGPSDVLLASQSSLTSVHSEESAGLLGVFQGAPARLSDGGQPQVLESFEQAGVGPVTRIAGQNADIAVIAEGDREIWLSRNAEPPERVFTGSNIRSLQYAASYLWWLGDVEGEPTIFRLSEDGTVASRQTKALQGRKIAALAISPDGVYGALSVNDDRGKSFGLVRIDNSKELSVDGWREIPLNWNEGKINSVSDVAWSSGSNLLLLGVTEDRTEIFATDSDVSALSSLGPYGDVETVKLAAQKRGPLTSLLAITNTARVLRFEEQYRWPVYAQEISDVSYVVKSE